ncbi:MAG: hypothetical protein CMP14_04500 [Rickettsiales bacterium]|nr:hypothetical protein [Rickettsiales bacterium]
MFAILLSVYRKPIEGKQALERWVSMVGLIAFFVVASSAKVTAVGPGQTKEYGVCMRLARVSPHEGFEAALAWTDAGGGGAAKHCAAVSLFSMKQYAEAAVRFEALARELRAEFPLQAKLLAQAGQAWHQAGESKQAFLLYTDALKISPSDPNIRIDRAMVSADSGQYEFAIEDLNAALAANPSMVQALILRASANRHLNKLDLALQDALRAIELSPDYPEAYLERGNIKRLLNDVDGARQDWLVLLKRFEGTPAADAAQRNLQKNGFRSE